MVLRLADHRKLNADQIVASTTGRVARRLAEPVFRTGSLSAWRVALANTLAYADL